MKRMMSWLTGLLALQLGLSAALFWYGQSGPLAKPAAPLLPVPMATVDRLVISDGDTEAVLVRAAGDPAAGDPAAGDPAAGDPAAGDPAADGWKLPGLGALPADDARSNSILTRLAALQTGWPVTTTTASHERFEVADDNFQRRVQLYSDGDMVAELLLGTSPGFRKVHLRRRGESNVYAVDLNTFELPAADNDWLDKSLLASPEATRIEGEDFTLERVGDDWRRSEARRSDKADDADESEPAPAGDDLASALTGLQVSGLAATDTELTQEPVKAFVIAGPDGDVRSLEFFRSDQDYLVKDVGTERLFTVSQYDFERITGEANNEVATESVGDEATPPGT